MFVRFNCNIHIHGPLIPDLTLPAKESARSRRARLQKQRRNKAAAKSGRTATTSDLDATYHAEMSTAWDSHPRLWLNPMFFPAPSDNDDRTIWLDKLDMTFNSRDSEVQEG